LAHQYYPVTSYLIIAAILYCGAQALQMGTGAARLAGVRSKRVATGLTLFNLFATTSRLLNLVYAPLMGALIDVSRRLGDIAGFERDLRIIIAAATVGTLIGGALTPTFAVLLQRGIRSFERHGSLVWAIGRLARPTTFQSAVAEFRMPALRMLRYSPHAIPKSFLIWNIVVMAFWVAGPLSAFYAGVIDPHVTGTALLLSGLITGVATITLTLVVDPTAAVITDQAALGMRPEQDIKAMLLYLVLSAVTGTLLAQVVLRPAAELIVTVARFLVDHGLQHA
jgi:Alternate to MurJ